MKYSFKSLIWDQVFRALYGGLFFGMSIGPLGTEYVYQIEERASTDVPHHNIGAPLGTI
jgi:hypothetical protein